MNTKALKYIGIVVVLFWIVFLSTVGYQYYESKYGVPSCSDKKVQDTAMSALSDWYHQEQFNRDLTPENVGLFGKSLDYKEWKQFTKEVGNSNDGEAKEIVDFINTVDAQVDAEFKLSITDSMTKAKRSDIRAVECTFQMYDSNSKKTTGLDFTAQGTDNGKVLVKFYGRTK
jgi:hypothetical protein